MALEVRRDLSVVVRAPRRMPRAEILRFVESEEAWIEPHIALMRQKNLAAEARRAQAPRFTDTEIRGLAERALERIPPRVRKDKHTRPAHKVGELLLVGKSEFQLPARARSFRSA